MSFIVFITLDLLLCEDNSSVVCSENFDSVKKLKQGVVDSADNSNKSFCD
jgi:hypothetical protein